MVDATETLRRISEKASKLNKSSDEINEIISAFEKKLVGMNIGVDVWLSDPEGNFFDPDSEILSDKPFTLWHGGKGNAKTAKQWEAEFLGYAKINNKWQLARVEARIVQNYDRETERWDQMVEYFQINPLSTAPRESRIKALGAMDRLLSAIEEKMDTMLDSIEAGKKFVKSIE